MNDNGGAACSSGCESGWTLYLEKSSWLSPNGSIICEDEDGDGGVRGGKVTGMIEEEDMSMVSDASSGPPPRFIDSLPPETGVLELSGAALGRKRRSKDKKMKQMLLLDVDDTASSRPVLRRPKKGEFGHRNRSQSVMESHSSMLDHHFSHGFSTTHLQDGPSEMDLYGHQYRQSQFLGGSWMRFK
uniref:Uncharacterized protein n=1 Tax=Kalanchoe fedtschenkoi TaxID=63787 RepID=A0A7N0UDS4_KALFE